MRPLRWLQDFLRRNATWRHRALAAEADLARVRTELALVRGVSEALDQGVAEREPVVSRPIEETAAEVLRLDQEAMQGPWCYEPMGPGAGAGRVSAGLVNVAQYAFRADATLIATYRTAAPELAREVLRLRSLGACLALAARSSSSVGYALGHALAMWDADGTPDTSYRPGLPSVEQMRAHEARGGRWMVQEGDDPPQVRHPRSFEWRFISQNVRTRPCLPDGTPCPWGDL